MKQVTIYTDGACSGNPGAGGWGAILMFNGREKEISGGERETTNNRMELMAVIAALKRLKEPCEVRLYSDSQYVVGAFANRWVESWQRNGWRTANKGEVKKRRPLDGTDCADPHAQSGIYQSERACGQ